MKQVSFDFKHINWRKSLPYLAIVAVFIVISLAYFYPATFEGRELFQGDVAGASGTAQDVRDYEAQTGEHSYWTNSLFGGMPMYQISPSYPSTEALQKTQYLLTLRTPINLLGTYAWMLFAMMLGFFIFLKALRVNKYLALIGSVAWAFSSYFIILIVAGHIWKLTALCFIPPTIAGMIWIYRGKYLKGAVLMTFFTALQVLANHVQMSYYFLIPMFCLFLAYLFEAIKQKSIIQFAKSTAVVVVAGLLGVAINASNIYHTYEYSKETMRGGSELTLKKDAQTDNTAYHENTGGLDKAYITQWSYGIGETLSLLVPNIKGGATGYMGNNESLMNDASPLYRDTLAQMNHYWGDQPFTAGPVYVGAIIFFLFILGVFIVKGPLKWALLAATILSILLSWGHNFMALSSFFIDYFPLYNKFRTVSSILVVAEFTIPALAVLALVELFKNPKQTYKENQVAIVVSLALSAGLALLLAMIPSVTNLMSNAELEMFNQAAGHPEVASIKTALLELREGIVRMDALRSFIYIGLAFAVLWAFAHGYIRKPWAAAVLLAFLCLIDLWQVDKRYLNDGHFIDTDQVAQRAAPYTDADRQIEADSSLGYRVFNATVDTYNDATTSRYHQSVGGYHAAKLQRYQDLIEHQLAKGNFEILNMLNTKYVIQPSADNVPTPVLNPDAYGPAWFVNQIEWVNNANEEMLALDSTKLHSFAVMDKRFESAELRGLKPMNDSTAQIKVVAYHPNKIVYQTQSAESGLAVFSEIYYPHGWTASIDGKDAPIVRANYVLRALLVPAGKHEIVFSFEPKSIKRTETIAKFSLGILALAVVMLLLSPFIRKKRESDL